MNSDEIERVKAWIPVVHKKRNQKSYPPEIQVMPGQGRYQDPQQALDVARQNCQQTKGRGYTIAPFYGESSD